MRLEQALQNGKRSVEQFARKILAGIASNLLRYLSTRVDPDNLELMCGGIFEHCRESFRTYHYRPQKSVNIGLWSDMVKDNKTIGVVVQGPLSLDFDFTVETVKIYKKILRNSIIVVSTWIDEDQHAIERMRSLGIEVLRNDKPSYAGQSNINLQIVSSFNGINRVGELGARYVLKTRTDQRFYAPNVEQYLINLLEIFPPTGGYKQKKRIIGVNLDSFKYRLYGINDLFIFGTISDMKRYWGCAHDTRPVVSVDPGISCFDFSRLRFCPTYLSTEFLKSIGFELKWTLQDSMKAYSEVFCIIDKESIDLMWPKYTKREFRYMNYDGIRTDQDMSFREWLNMYANLNNIILQDDIMKKGFGEKYG